MIDSIKFALYITVHPFDGYWDMKYEKKGKLKIALALVFVVFLVSVFTSQVTGFYFNRAYGQPLDILLELRRVILPFILFSIANWSITTLMDGEGKFSEIIMAVGYSLTPIILIRFPLTIITNFLVSDEAAYVNALLTVSSLWCIFLIFAGILTVHQYTPSKTLFTLLLTLCSMAVMLFIGMLFFSLASEIVGFLYSVYRELSFRF